MTNPAAPRRVKARVRLRPLTVADVTPAYVKWFRDPGIRRWIAGGTPTAEGCRAYIAKWLTDPNAMLWGIVVDGRVVGTIKAERLTDQAVLGLLIGDARMRGHGVGVKAISQAARWCLRHWKVGRVAAGIHPFNTRSMRAFEKCGFQVAERDPPRVWLKLEKP